MGLTLVTPPTTWPVTLDEAKAQCGVLHAFQDSFIEGKIRAATQFVENELSNSIAVRTWKLTLDEFSDAIELPRGPVQSVTSVQYSDEDGITQTADAGLYTTDLISARQWVVLNSSESWPDTLDAVNAVSVTYVAGYDEAPDDIREAILVQIQLLYERGSDPKIAELQSRAVDSLIQTHRTILV